MASVGVAYSGGRDSTALLHATLIAAEAAGIEVLALHVHHGLHPQADAWLEHCRARCRRWARAGRPIRLAFERLPGAPARGESIEAWARAGRYRALAEMARAQGCGLVLLAQHRRDQAETVLLQALRGAGLAGLAAMPAAVERDRIVWHRPWLAQPSAAIDAYVRRHRLRHVEDASNDDPRHARNRLRHAVWPALLQAFPDAEGALASSATWAQEARECLDEVAAEDLAGMADAQGLHIPPWQALSSARRSNALRAWLEAALGAAAPGSLVQRLLHELPGSGPAAWPAGVVTLRRHRGRLRCNPTPAGPQSCGPDLALCLGRPGVYELPGWPGHLRVERVREGGVAAASLDCVQVSARRGGEQFQSGTGRPPRSLKKQYQAAGLPAWERDGPVIFSAGQLVYASGLGIDARCLARPGEAQLTLEWIRDGDAPGPRRAGQDEGNG
ncbi:MAG: tRNA lysidine(34) synthetase TilS [Burkholderiaceae bacterium]